MERRNLQSPFYRSLSMVVVGVVNGSCWCGIQTGPNILSWHYYPPEFAPVDKPNSGVPDPFLSFLGRDFLVSHSSNCLLLCERLPDYRRGYKYITYCVCNPTTKEYVLLPQPIQQPYFPINSISIAFDPSKSAHYKVVCISGTKSSHCCVNIYSSKTGLWRLSEQGPRIHRMCRKGVFWNGALHWTTGCYQSTLSFHVEKESFQTTKLPPKPTPLEIPRIYKYFGESNGHLYLIETYNVMVTEFHILEMKSDYSQWSVKYSVNFDSVLKAYPEMLVPSVLFYSEKDLKDPCLRISFTGLRFLVREGGELVLWMCIPGKIIWYRITDGTFGKYCDLATRMYGGCYFGGYSWLEVHSYSNTLSSIRPTSS
ncbi:F-box protein At5g07610-like [Magnolia sinica]|uniref:F-box protein At5g07610-like n=1 Tax=Magnolia sinica TaxID=86752 RepID=UPI00265A9325|nr:F-box protein At5g07610-like [Magnolia sinica]